MIGVAPSAIGPPHPRPSALPPEDAWLLDLAARRLRPRVDVRPSAWAAEHLVLSERESSRPGPVRVGFRPWFRVMLDGLYDDAAAGGAKQGEVWICAAQVAKSTAVIAKALASINTRPGNGMYLLETGDKARAFANDRFAKMVRGSRGGVLQRVADSARAAGERNIMLEIPGRHASIVVATGASESATTSQAARDVYIDEFEMVQDAALKFGVSDVYTSAKKRTATWRHQSGIHVLGHPRLMHQGLHQIWYNESDRGAWGFDCPHCRRWFAPRWSMVRYARIDEDSGLPDPTTAALHCPHDGCEKIITDAERCAAVWEPEFDERGNRIPGGRPGGSGRRGCELDDEEAARRPFLGLWVSGLNSPDRSVVSFAKDKHAADLRARAMGLENGGPDPSALSGPSLDWWNKDMGEPFAPASTGEVDDGVLDLAVGYARGGGWGVGRDIAYPAEIAFLAVGADVQAPEDNPTIITCTCGFATTGDVFVVDYRACPGWLTYHQYLRTAQIRTEDGRVLGVMADCVDPNWPTQQVLAQAREILFSSAGGMIKRMVARFEPSAKGDSPMYMAPDRKRVLAGLERLGEIDYRFVNRHYWVNRSKGRLKAGTFKVLCPVPTHWKKHMTANVLRPVRDTTGWARGLSTAERMQWDKPKDVRDDWFIAGVYADIAAVALCRYEELHLTRGQWARDRTTSRALREGEYELGLQVPRFT